MVSCGGGVVLEPANRVTLRASGEVVFLSVPLEVQTDRVSNVILKLDPEGHAAVEWNEKKAKGK